MPRWREFPVKWGKTIQNYNVMNCDDWWYQSLIFPYPRLELFASYFKGHAMSKVATGLQDQGIRKFSCGFQIQVSDLTFHYKNLLAQCLSFSVHFIPPNRFGLMSSTSCHGSCLFPISKTFFSSHVIVPYCWHLSSKLATCRVWNSSTFYIPTLKIFYWLPIDKRSLANQCRCFPAAVNF